MASNFGEHNPQNRSFPTELANLHREGLVDHRRNRTAQATLENLPQVPIEIILRLLKAEDIAALHVSSQKLFWRCSEFILHSKEKKNWEESEKLRRANVPRDNKELSEVEEEILQGYWDCALVHRKHQYPPFLCICLDLKRKFSREEISRLVEHYQHRMQYFIFKYRTSKWRYFPLIGVRLGYRHLELVPSLDYKVLFDTYRPLEFPPSQPSASDRAHRGGADKLYEFREAFERRCCISEHRCQ